MRRPRQSPARHFRCHARCRPRLRTRRRPGHHPRRAASMRGLSRTAGTFHSAVRKTPGISPLTGHLLCGPGHRQIVRDITDGLFAGTTGAKTSEAAEDPASAGSFHFRPCPQAFTYVTCCPTGMAGPRIRRPAGPPDPMRGAIRSGGHCNRRRVVPALQRKPAGERFWKAGKAGLCRLRPCFPAFQIDLFPAPPIRTATSDRTPT